MTELQYITDATGKRTAVILPIEDYEALIEEFDEVDDPELVAAINESLDSPVVPRERLLELLEKQS